MQGLNRQLAKRQRRCKRLPPTILLAPAHNSAGPQTCEYLHAFFAYAAYLNPEHADLIARVLAKQPKKTHTTVLTYLTDSEADALLGAPDQTTRTGSRDHAIIMVLLATGLRISELAALTRDNLRLGRPAYLLRHGKGRKDRITPLTTQAALALRRWVAGSLDAGPQSPVFTAQSSIHPISRDALAARLRVYAVTAAKSCTSIAGKTIMPYTLRYPTAMRMLGAGIDITTIAFNLARAAGALALTDLAKARTATIRRKLIQVPACISTSARKILLHLPTHWPWETGWTRLFAVAIGPPQTITF